jgi:hypothetical protein
MGDRFASTRTSELVIALCGPIGSPLHKVAKTIKACLLTDFGYETCEVIRLSQIIQDHNGKVVNISEFKRINKLVKLGNKMCDEHGSSILAELAISKIAQERQRFKTTRGEERLRSAPNLPYHRLDKKPRRAKDTQISLW